MMLRWPKLGLTRPYYKYLWRCWLLVGLVLLQRISYGRMEEILQLRSSGRGSTGGSGAQHHQQRQQLEEQELFSSSSSSNEIECPSFAENSACPCYKFEDGLFLECPSITAVALRSTLQLISSPIQSLSVYEFDRSVKSLTADLFASTSSHASAHTSTFLGVASGGSSSSTGNDVNIRHLQFSHSNLQQLKENSLNNLRAHLESLSIVNGKLTQVPTKALAGMKKLMVLDFEQNEISAIEEYAFYGLHVVKLNMKGNRLERIPETGFVGLEDSLAELDLSENRLKQFPTSALKRLENLRQVRLAMNEINSLEQDDSYTRFGSLVFLDLSVNNFVELYSDVFGAFPYVKTLSLYNNFIELVHRDSFVSLKELQSLDLSHNRIVFVDAEVFAANRKLHTVDLSHNHIHYVSGVFSNLPLLREIFLSENNILELTDDCFSNSSSIKVIYLENNSIQRLDAEALSSLFSLEQLYLSGNHIRRVPMGFFETTGKLQSLSLDNNLISELDVRVFRRLLNLREIRLNGNQIRVIQEQLFGTLGALMELHLQNNAIRVIERNAFKNCQLLQYINLQENALDEIDIMFYYSTETSANHLQQPLTARGKLITAKTGGSDASMLGEVDSVASSALISIQLNSNALKYLHERSFQGQSSVQTIWLENNQLNSLDKELFVDLVQLERLYLKNNSISSIDPNAFNSLRRLRFLDLSLNRLTSLNEKLFKNMAELDELLISKNQLQKLPANVFGSLQKLRVLDLSHNPIGILESDVFHQNFSVSVINLKGCELTRIESDAFKGLQNLNELNLDDNHLRSEDIKQIDASSLRTLRLASNNFTVVRENTLERLPSLQVLVLERCSIRDLPYPLLSKNNNLVKLDLSHNLLRTLKRTIFNNLNVFKELRLQNNSINDFPHIALSNISTLETLVLSQNQLTNVDFFKLHGLPNLRHLDLQDNTISSLTGFNTATLPHLDMINLSGNLLLALPENFFKHSISLQRIDLSCNRFRQIPNTALSEFSLARLAWLNLTGNPLQRIHHTMTTDIDQRRFPFLKELHISQTNLTILTSKDFDIYPALQRLYLVQNRINRVSPGAFVALSNLQILDLSVNEIEMLPKERLQGLRLLEILNISNNNIKELDEFTDDLQRLKVLDISSNQLERIQKNTLRHLVALQELYLNGNRIRSISSDAFRTLRALVTLDLRKNFFEDVPLRALKPLETHLKQLRLEENHLNCSCDTQELWEWLSDHRKWTSENVRCEQPAEVHGKSLLAMEPLEFCDVPMILKIAIQDIQPYSVLVSWQSREHSGLHGYHVIFHSLDTVEDFRGKTLNRLANSAKLDRLSSNTRYLICVLGLGNWLSSQNDIHSLLNQSNQIQNQVLNNQNGFMAGELDTSFSNTLLSLMMDTPTSKCTEVRTLDSIGPNPLAEVDGISSQGIIHSILTRRLGLIVGCCLGIIVFIVLVSVLGYLKIKKQRLDAAKRQQQPMAPEFISYRHFSIPNDEHGRDGVAGAGGGAGGGGTNSFLHNNHHHQHNHHNQQPVTTVDGHPSFISGAVLGTTTTLNGGGSVPGAEERKKIYIDS